MRNDADTGTTPRVREPVDLVDVKKVPRRFPPRALKRKEITMRPLVEPPPSLHCLCGGELQLKLIEPAASTLGKEREIFVCTNCRREQTFLADRSPYGPPTSCGAGDKISSLKPSDKVPHMRRVQATLD
jgi:hypothetical protein